MKVLKKIFVVAIAAMMAISASSICTFAEERINDEVIATLKGLNNEVINVYKSDIQDGPVSVVAFDGGTVTIETDKNNMNLVMPRATYAFINYIPSVEKIVAGGPAYNLTYNVPTNYKKYTPHIYIPGENHTSMIVRFFSDINYGGLVKGVVYKNGNEYVRTQMNGTTGVKVSVANLVSLQDEIYGAVDNTIGYTSSATGTCVIEN